MGGRILIGIGLLVEGGVGGVLVTLAFGRGVGGLGRIFVEVTPCHRCVLVCGLSVDGGRTGVRGFRWLAGDRRVVVGVIG